MGQAVLIFPHQLFLDHPALVDGPRDVTLMEDPLFFGDPQYPANMHRQKLWLHRATMARYAAWLTGQGHRVTEVTYRPDTAMVADHVAKLAAAGVTEIVVADPSDFTLERRLNAACADITLTVLDSPCWINTTADNHVWADGRKRWFMAEYYKYQRRRMNILMDGDAPMGGKWSFDEDNRKKVPKAKLGDVPDLPPLNRDQFDLDARDSVLRDFPDAVGRIDQLIYPTSHDDAARWLDRFLADRFHLFGDYEDAIVEGESWLWHSVLTPALNIGLLTPQQVLHRTLHHAATYDVPLNAVEGFVRQVIGWREFMRATYLDLGVKMRTTNHWNHTRKMPACFYDATTGIDPVDDTIRRVLDTGYCHHIERLMVLGGIMFLCEIDPDDVYRWFMEMFVDSYDWVMVPNAYAMSQHADGGLITTKPYFSGSNYARKMSHWKTGDWSTTWDGLYWRFIWKHCDRLAGNPRWAMMCRTVAKMDNAKLNAHLDAADQFLARLD